MLLLIVCVRHYALQQYTDETSGVTCCQVVSFLGNRHRGWPQQPHTCSFRTREWSLRYRCVATSPEGLVQQLAVCYLRHGYWWYVAGRIPVGKDPFAVDQKLIEKCGIDLTDYQRAKRKRNGLANMQYIRHRRFFLLLVTEGHHPFKKQERNRIRDRLPIGQLLSQRVDAAKAFARLIVAKAFAGVQETPFSRRGEPCVNLVPTNQPLSSWKY